jgi:uncharacterized protein (TIGR02996 family)
MPRTTTPELPPPRPELASLLAAAKDAPDDDAPRLVLADWLEEQNGEADRAWGELVRNEVQLQRAERDDRRCRAASALNLLEPGYVHSQECARQARAALHAARPELQALAERDVRLIQRWREPWAGPLFGRGVYWSRGLLALHCGANGFPSRFMSAVAGSELGSWLSELKLQHCKPDDVWRIARCPLLAELTDLRLNSRNVGPDGAAALACSPHLGRLACVSLSYARLGDDGVEAIAGAGWPSLAELQLGHTWIKSRGAAALAASAWLGRLRRLDLAHNEVDADTAAALFAGQTMPRLEWLNLGNNKLGPEGVEALLAPGRFPALRGLSLNLNAIGPDGLRTLLAWPGLSGVTALALDGGRLGDAEAEALAGRAALANLTCLSLGGNTFGDAGLLALARSPHLRGLVALNVLGNRIGPAGGAALADAEHFPDLFWLSARYNNLGDAAERIRQRLPSCLL